ncbi:hypothetical protein EYF80_029492 [Liparis tanakae]|uniref:Uncharacterized protein n=1 Tax=Liparis tanakae TaxID=230148 RepID=A0A4Z2H391_9TELE|nr:hypothetical protein EYF80_029492 [Liparis tanakae]
MAGPLGRREEVSRGARAEENPESLGFGEFFDLEVWGCEVISGQCCMLGMGRWRKSWRRRREEEEDVEAFSKHLGGADGDVYCIGVDPILVSTDSFTASHHFVAAACQHLVNSSKVFKRLLRSLL